MQRNLLEDEVRDDDMVVVLTRLRNFWRERQVAPVSLCNVLPLLIVGFFELLLLENLFFSKGNTMTIGN